MGLGWSLNSVITSTGIIWCQSSTESSRWRRRLNPSIQSLHSFLATHSQSNRGNAFFGGRVMEIIKMIISYIWFIHHHFILFTNLPFSYIASYVITPSLLYSLHLPCCFPSLYSPYTRPPSLLYLMYFPFFFPPFASY